MIDPAFISPSTADKLPSQAVTRANLICAVTKYRLPFWHYKILADWLGCYQYVLPADRKLRIVPKLSIKEPLDALHMYQLCDLYSTTLTPQEQVILAMTIGKDYVCAISP